MTQGFPNKHEILSLQFCNGATCLVILKGYIKKKKLPKLDGLSCTSEENDYFSWVLYCVCGPKQIPSHTDSWFANCAEVKFSSSHRQKTRKNAFVINNYTHQGITRKTLLKYHFWADIFQSLTTTQRAEIDPFVLITWKWIMQRSPYLKGSVFDVTMPWESHSLQPD